MTAPPTSPADDPVSAEVATPADGEATLHPGSVFIGQNDVRFALEAGFSEDEVAFMLNLDNSTPETIIDSTCSAGNDKEPPPR